MGRSAHCLRTALGEAVAVVTHALLIVALVVPLAAMLAALFAAVWIHEGRREAEATASSGFRAASTPSRISITPPVTNASVT